MVAKLQQRGVFLQHAGDLHLNLVAQRLALEVWWREREGGRDRGGKEGDREMHMLEERKDKG